MAEFFRAFGEVTIMEPPHQHHEQQIPLFRAYPAWDYRKQIVIGSTDLNVIPQPAAGLPLRPHQ